MVLKDVFSNMEPRGLEHWAFSYGALVSLHKDSSLSDNPGLTVQPCGPHDSGLSPVPCSF